MAQPKTKSDTLNDPSQIFEVPEGVRDMAEKSVSQAKDAYARFKAAADETGTVLEGSFTTASKGISSLGVKAIETARSNTNATFDHLLALFDVKTISDAVELQTKFLRQQTEALTQQAKEFGELAQKVATDASAPVKAQFEKSLKQPA